MTPHDLLHLGDEMTGFGRTPSDSCVAFDAGVPVKKALATINATTGDLMLAKQLGCDTVLVHHPLAGSARRGFHRVLSRMVELMTEQGVSSHAALDATQQLRDRCRYNDHAGDYDHLVSAARLLGLNLLNIHLAADELGRREMVKALEGVGPEASVEDATRALHAIPELAHADNEILIVPESPMRQVGRIAVMHAGGTNGGAEAAEALFEAGVGTVVYIHISGDAAARLRSRAEAGGLGGVIVTGHIASDAIGMNILLAEAQQRGIEFVRHGGLGSFDPR